MTSTVVLPAAACTAASWIGLVIRFYGRGRLSGTWRSRGCFALVIAATTGVTVLTSTVLLPHASQLPPVAVGLVAGSAVAPRQKAPSSGRAVTALLTFGISYLLGELSRRLANDRADWGEEMTRGLTDGYVLREFACAARDHMLARLGEPGFGVSAKALAKRRAEIETRCAEAVKAAEKSIKTDTDIEKSLRDTGRLATQQDRTQSRMKLGEARHYCQLMLHLAHDHGPRSNDHGLRSLRAGIAARAEPPAWRDVPQPRSGEPESSVR
ncbi:hypothetical protein [Streptomyces sp. MI02-7b]|uniref:hypothetical protein n=1 Tax=Streptomyces sp. MI02-7b TaxID=462941 RepID=UPI0029B92558|nr:hypothetical protein [Streptomyces sp. MI02-7b]MDX3078429.1 hypothetical protein [Streptomyces sp. MI02-7b]